MIYSPVEMATPNKEYPLFEAHHLKFIKENHKFIIYFMKEKLEPDEH